VLGHRRSQALLSLHYKQHNIIETEILGFLFTHTEVLESAVKSLTRAIVYRLGEITFLLGHYRCRQALSSFY